MKTLVTILMLTAATSSFSQVEENLSLTPFSKVYVHPYFDVVLKEGAEEKVEILDYRNIDPELIKVEVKGKRLRMYIEGERITYSKLKRSGSDWDMYRGARVKVEVTYKDLEKLVVYGEDPIKLQSDVKSDRFKLALHGEVDADIQSIKADKLKLALYGENRLEINEGQVKKQIVKSYGENEVIEKRVNTNSLKYINFGEGELYTGDIESMRVTAFGSAFISYNGNPVLSNKIAIGEMTFVSR